MNLCSRCL